MPTLWNHELSGYASAARKPSTLPARALVLSQPGDCVQLDPALKTEYPHVRGHHDRIGLATADEIVYDLSYAVAHRYPEHELRVWLFGDEAHAVHPNPTRLAAVRYLNHKNHFILWCLQHGWPVPDTVVCWKGEFTGTRLELPLYVKGAVSMYGNDVFPCDTWDKVAEAVAVMGNVDFQFQAALPHVASLNVQYLGIEGRAEHLDTTYQVPATRPWMPKPLPSVASLI